MAYGAIDSDLESVVQWLEGTDEQQWEDQIDILEQEILPQLESIAGGFPRPDKSGTRSAQPPQMDANTRRAAKATPYLRAMLSAMRSKRRVEALGQGTSALLVLRDAKRIAHRATAGKCELTVVPVGTINRFWSITIKDSRRDLLEPIHDFAGTLEEARLRACRRATLHADLEAECENLAWIEVELPDFDE